MKSATTSDLLQSRIIAAQVAITTFLNDKQPPLRRTNQVRFARHGVQCQADFDDSPWLGEWDNTEK